MSDPVHIETLRAPTLYAVAQIDMAFRIAAMLAMICPDERGKLVLVEEPA